LLKNKQEERTFYHFSSLRDIKIHGVYINSLSAFLNQYSFSINSHYHDFYSIIFITGGNGTICICNEEISVKQGSVLLVAPNQMHSFNGMQDCTGELLFFCQDFFVEEFSYVRLLNTFSYVTPGENMVSGPGFILNGPDVTPLFGLLSSIREEYDSGNQPSGSMIILRSYLNILMIKISGLFEKKTGKINHAESSLIQALTNYIESNFKKEHNTEFYASAFNITDKHLNNICKSNFNCSLKKILHDRLMQESRKLLLSTELSVTEIAYRLNFDDNSYFNKVFRKSTGLTPKRFREMHRKFLP
jgi:AraC-like DNA-binding protein